MTMRTFVAMLVSTVVLGAGLVACGGSGPSGAGGGEAAVAAGEALVQNQACGSCHSGSKGAFAGGDAPKGGVYGPNLTPDMDTGIGGWTDEQIKRAIASGKDDEDASLCGSMPRFSTLSDTDLSDIVAYLRSLAPVKNEVPEGTCSQD
jgi:cytochrome c553